MRGKESFQQPTGTLLCLTLYFASLMCFPPALPVRGTTAVAFVQLLLLTSNVHGVYTNLSTHMWWSRFANLQCDYAYEPEYHAYNCHLGTKALSVHKDCLLYRRFVSRPEQGLAPGLPTANNFLKGASFSPDGTCLLTSSDDTVLRVFEVPNHVLRGVRYSYQISSRAPARPGCQSSL